MKRKGIAAPLTKSLVFVAVTSLATGVLAVSIAQTDSGDRAAYNARFSDASGLRAGDSVRIAGVEVGRVEKISVVDHRIARVRFTVERDRKLPSSASATIKYLNLVGQRYIQIDQGAGDLAPMTPGGTIPVERTTPALDLTVLFNGFKPLFQALSPQDVNALATSIVKVMQGEGGTVESILSTVGSLTGTIAGKDDVIGQVIDNLNATLKTINTRSDNLVDLITTMQKLVSGLARDRKPIGNAIGALDALARSTAGLLQVGREPFKQDLAQLKRLSGNLDREAPTLDRFLKNLPVKLENLTRLGSYGSWLNFYICQATVTGAAYQEVPGEPQPPLTGVPNTAARCTS
ncbi:MAG: MCE family protein [Streptosporangiaceae bacterium]